MKNSEKRIQVHKSLINIEKHTGDGIHTCGTPDDKARGADFDPSTLASTSTTIRTIPKK
jgi:hypothetical protein